MGVNSYETLPPRALEPSNLRHYDISPRLRDSGLPHLMDQRSNRPPLLDRSYRISSVLEGILIPLRRSRRRSAVYPATPVWHPRRLARLAASGPRTASGRLLQS